MSSGTAAYSILLPKLLDDVVGTEEMMSKVDINKFRSCTPQSKNFKIFQVSYDKLDPDPFCPPVPAAGRNGRYRGDGENTTGLLQDT